MKPHNYVKVLGPEVNMILPFSRETRDEAMSAACVAVNAHDATRPRNDRGQVIGGARLSVWQSEKDWPLCAVIGETY